MGPTVEGAKGKKIILWSVAMVFVISLISFFTLGMWLLTKETIYAGVYIESIDVSDLTKEEAREEVERIYEEQLNKYKVDLLYGEYQRQLAYKELGYTYNYEEVVDKAFNVGREGNIIRKMQDIFLLKNQHVYIPIASYYETESIEAVIEDIEANINKSAKDASIQRRNGSFHITKEEIGRRVDKEALIHQIQTSSQRFSQEEIIIPVIYDTPDITEEKLLAIGSVLGEYSTTFNTEQRGRSHNIALAAERISDTLLMPGEEFSFNQQTAPRGREGGYQEAPVIVDGELVPGIGGGICQVSTTLYNVVVMSNLEVSSRRNHSRPVGYVPLGHDATVYGDVIDFKFINSLQYPIYVESFVQNNRLFVRMHGKRENNIKIALNSEIIETIEPQIEIREDQNRYVGEKEVIREAKNGFRVNTYKVYSENGRELRREHISTDRYVAVDGIIVEGRKPKPQEEIGATTGEEKQQIPEKSEKPEIPENEKPVEEDEQPVTESEVPSTEEKVETEDQKPKEPKETEKKPSH